MKKRLYLDTETCGLHGMPVLIQYAIEDGPITLHEVWRQPIGETLDLIETFCDYAVVGFNLTFDWFQLVKCYTVFRLCPREWIPIEHVNEIAMLEPQGQDGPCLKPASALDLMLYSRKGPFQSLMARDDVRIKRVPTALAYALADELESRVQLDGIYFARSKDKDAPRWKVYDRKDRFGDLDANFKDVVLKFNPAGGLKFLAEYALGLKPKFHYEDVEPDPKWRPYELGFAPTALAVGSPDSWQVWGRKKTLPDVKTAEEEEESDEITRDKRDKLLGIAWPGVIHHFVNHWANNANAREYASDDIVYTRALDEYFGSPEPGDDDSVLACAIAVVRWHGFAIDLPGVRALRDAAQHVVDASPVNVNKPTEVRAYVTEMMSEIEQLVLSQSDKSTIIDSTKKNNLEAIAKWTIKEQEVCCEKGCPRCKGTGYLEVGPHPAALRAKEILGVKSAAKERELFNKLLIAGKFHCGFNIIGTLSGRMSGSDGLNAQGIKRTKNVRRMFPLKWKGMVLGIGDFDGFELCIADAVCDDAQLRNDLTEPIDCPYCNGNGCDECKGTGKTTKKLHGIFATLLNPGLTYVAALLTKGSDNDLYTTAKMGLFGGVLYFGGHHMLTHKLGIDSTVAQNALEATLKRYAGLKRWQDEVQKRFCSMQQPRGLGTQVVWVEPAEYAESFLGFRRYYTLENRICKALFDLARKPPKEWRDCLVKVVRRDRVQTAGGAVSSSLYGAAFNLQSANMRSAGNHYIQSPGAKITKSVQRSLWDLQPVGISELLIALAQVHDEIFTISKPNLSETIAETVQARVAEFREKVPLLSMEWNSNASSWADK